MTSLTCIDCLLSTTEYSAAILPAVTLDGGDAVCLVHLRVRYGLLEALATATGYVAVTRRPPLAH